jgi:hypothetical protein
MYIVITSTIYMLNLIILVAPVITCEPNAAFDNQMNVYVSCVVWSSPRATTLFWVIDVNGTTLSEGQIVDEYWTLVEVSTAEPIYVLHTKTGGS